ncbi:MAG TPA: hypothetical protein P5511_00265, partial [Candidatus Goldiibacteriota bacterium]|nr:hypothetical protein [Candidatus Goldiibacteriota bacterium]
IWGALNGFYLIFSIITKAPREAAEKAVFSDRNPGIYRLYRVAVTFILTCLAWVFFRASNVQDAFYIIGSMFGGSDTLIFLKILGSSSKQEFIANYYRIRDYIETLGLSRIEFVIAAASVIFMETVHFLLRRGESLEMLNKQHMIVRWGIYLVLALSILNLSMGQEEPFIYFQF